MKFVPFLLLSWMAAFASPCPAQESPTANSPESALTDSEKREIILYVEKYSIQVEAERILRDALQRQDQLQAKERELAAREIETEKSRTAIAEKESSQQKERADFYKDALERATKKRGFGCTMKKIFTFGLGRCTV